MAALVKKNRAKGEKIFELKEEEVSIGRNQKCIIAIDDNKVSKHHARVFKNEYYYEIEDMCSSNGTFINGKKITRTILKNGDRVMVGESLLIYYDDISQRTAKQIAMENLWTRMCRDRNRQEKLTTAI